MRRLAEVGCRPKRRPMVFLAPFLHGDRPTDRQGGEPKIQQQLAVWCDMKLEREKPPWWSQNGGSEIMDAARIVSARCATDGLDLGARQQALTELGFADQGIYTNRGLTGAGRVGPSLDKALAVARHHGRRQAQPLCGALSGCARSPICCMGRASALRSVRRSTIRLTQWTGCSLTFWQPLPSSRAISFPCGRSRAWRLIKRNGDSGEVSRNPPTASGRNSAGCVPLATKPSPNLRTCSWSRDRFSAGHCGDLPSEAKAGSERDVGRGSN